VTRLQLRPGLVVPVLAGVLACQPAPSPGDDEGDGEESSGGAGGSSEGEESSGEAPVDARYTYWRDIKAIVDARCATCHQPGTIAPFALQTADEVVALAPALRSSLELGTMPPWPPSAQCNTYAHDRSLPDAQRDMILAWVDDGAPVGDPADAPPPGDPGEQIAWDAELVMPEAYQTSGALLDDYRCFVMDWPLDQPKYVTGFEAVPDQPSIVHHVIAFVIPPDAAQTYKDLDDGEAGPGYTCYGGPGGGFSQQWLGAWAPGSQPSSDPDRGILVQPGSAVVLQMHYHPTPEPPADRSKIRVTLSDDVRYEQVVLPFTNPEWVGGSGMRIPAGEAGVTHQFQIDLIPFIGQVFPDAPLVAGEPFLLHTVSLHMHTRGTRASLTVERKDGGSDCGLYIPRWDFNWQGGYKLDEPIVVNPGDELSLTCEWDNSPENQPIVDGELMPAKDVYWGEGTGDEMCLAVMTVSAL
jgi:hypothetical protein